MKKTVIILAIIIGILSVNKTETIIIPKEAIRFRVIANSNNEKDQIIKKKVVNNLKKNIENIQTTSLLETRNNINKSLPDFKSVVEDTLKNEQVPATFFIIGNQVKGQKETILRNDKTKINEKDITHKCVVISTLHGNARWNNVCLVYG